MSLITSIAWCPDFQGTQDPSREIIARDIRSPKFSGYANPLKFSLAPFVWLFRIGFNINK